MTTTDLLRGAAGTDVHTDNQLDEELRDAVAAFLANWLGVDLLINGAPLTSMLSRIEVSFTDASTTHTVHENSTASLPPGPYASHGVEKADLMDAYEDWRHPLWADAVESCALSGTWVHPQTRYEIDSLAFARNIAGVYLGCLDRANPAAARRWDPTTQGSLCPVTNDLGVIRFPLRTHWVPNLVGQGLPVTAASAAMVASSMAEAGVHEALELHQRRRGVPVLDPHKVSHPIVVTCTFPTGHVVVGDAAGD